MLPKQFLMVSGLLATSILPSAACGGKDTAAPLAKVSLTANAARVPLGSPIELTYRFELAAGAVIPGDYLVFMHVKTPDGTRLWGDDHQPPTPTSQWKAGQPIEYTRTRFVPVGAHLGEATVEVGLYRGDERLPLQGPDAADNGRPGRSYRVAGFQFVPQVDNVSVGFADGWHGVEFPAEEPSVTWQWSRKAGTLTLRNPRRDATLLLEFDGRPGLAGPAPRQVSVSIGDKVISTFAADQPDRSLQRIPIAVAQFGAGEMVAVRLEVDRVFVPAKVIQGSADVRELGIRVYHAFVQLR